MMKGHSAHRGASARPASVHSVSSTSVAQPARKVITRRTARVIGLFASVKMKRLVPWESQLELDYLRLMEVDNSVVAFHAQPEVCLYQLQGKEHRYFPDLRVELSDGSIRMVEVKYKADANTPENKERFALIKALYAERRISFEVVTELDIRRQPRLANAKLMLDYRDCEPSESMNLRVAEAFAVRRPVTLGDLEAALGFPTERRGEFYAMALRGHFGIDLENAPLSADSLITGCVLRSSKGEQ